MNCNEARILLSAYRELNESQSIEVDIHLETCPQCRQVLAQQSIIGEGLRLLPTIEAAPDAHAKLMRTLAAEHASYLQHASASATPATPAPNFLKPYIKEHLRETAVSARRAKHVTSTTNTIAALSTADTGPLPVLSSKQRRRSPHMNQFAILGLAAAFLLTMLTGGLVSLLLLASHSLSGGGVADTVNSQSQVTTANYTAQTAYPNVVSAMASNGHIYYSAYGNGEQQWMIERVDSTLKGATSTPLFSSSVNEPVFVLGVSRDWLIWLQFDTAHAVYQQPVQAQQKHVTITNFARNWTLYALPLQANSASNTPIVLSSGVFNSNTVPTWIHTPIQGLSFVQADTLLVAMVDAKGNSSLAHYLLNSHSAMTSTVLATASNGHVLTSPTADSTGTYTFWSEEWLTDDNMLHGNIWEQETSSSLTRGSRGWQPLVTADKHILRADEASFHPQVVNDTLFFLSTGPTSASGQGTQAQGTPGATSTSTTSKVKVTAMGTPAPIKVTTPSYPVTTRFDSALYLTQVDETLPGTLLALPLDNSVLQPKVMSTDGQAAAPQGGTRFLLWQDSSGYQMYDAEAKLPVSVSTLPRNAAFLAVNGDTTVWIASRGVANNATGNSASAANTMTPVTFNWFSWSSNR